MAKTLLTNIELVDNNPMQDTATQNAPIQEETRHNRYDLASGTLMAKQKMIRFVHGPEGRLYADIKAKLPGRGIWIAANKQACQQALTPKIIRGALKLSAKENLEIEANYYTYIEKALKQSVHDLIGMAKRAGEVECGADQVKALAQRAQLAARFEARNGAAGGRAKIRTISTACARACGQAPPPVIGCFDCAELGSIIGRDAVVHLGVKRGYVWPSLHKEIIRLAGFCTLIPEEWEDKAHEHGLKAV